MIDKKRRRVMGMMGAGAVTVPLTAVVGSLPSYAQDDLPLVDPTSDAAVALAYAAVAPDPAVHCANCALYQGAEGDEHGPCPLFPGNSVHAEGWCSAHVPIA